jgi:hypothetical protein
VLYFDLFATHLASFSVFPLSIHIFVQLLNPGASHLFLFNHLRIANFPTPLFLIFMRVMGAWHPAWHPPAMPLRSRNSSFATVLNSFHFISLRTLLRSSKTQLFSFQAIRSSFAKNTRWGYGVKRRSQMETRTQLHHQNRHTFASYKRRGNGLTVSMRGRLECRSQER